jgi:hypothetical protein
MSMLLLLAGVWVLGKPGPWVETHVYDRRSLRDQEQGRDGVVQPVRPAGGV